MNCECLKDTCIGRIVKDVDMNVLFDYECSEDARK